MAYNQRDGATPSPLKRTEEQRRMVQPINLVFRFLQNRERVCIWLYGSRKTRIEGVILGFDQYMNLVMDEAAELNLRKRTRRGIGKILLKGDCIALIHAAEPK